MVLCLFTSFYILTNHTNVCGDEIYHHKTLPDTVHTVFLNLYTVVTWLVWAHTMYLPCRERVAFQLLACGVCYSLVCVWGLWVAGKWGWPIWTACVKLTCYVVPLIANILVALIQIASQMCLCATLSELTVALLCTYVSSLALNKGLFVPWGSITTPLLIGPIFSSPT